MARYIDDDLAWLAIDAAGYLAMFTTGGVAPIPSAVLNHSELATSAQKLVEQLPEVGKSQLLVSLPRPNDFIGFACRGIFAYDWLDVHRIDGLTRCYEMIARPDRPLLVNEISTEVSAVARLIRFDAIIFANTSMVPVERLVPCES